MILHEIRQDERRYGRSELNITYTQLACSLFLHVLAISSRGCFCFAFFSFIAQSLSQLSAALLLGVYMKVQTRSMEFALLLFAFFFSVRFVATSMFEAVCFHPYQLRIL